MTSTSFCCLEGSSFAKWWGQGNSGQAPGRGWRVTQGCGKNVGHPLSSRGRPLETFLFFFFFKGFKIKFHLTLKEQVIASKTQSMPQKFIIYSIILLLNIDANILNKILTHGMSSVSEE